MLNMRFLKTLYFVDCAGTGGLQQPELMAQFWGLQLLGGKYMELVWSRNRIFLFREIRNNDESDFNFAKFREIP
jgi:hypothetical protein